MTSYNNHNTLFIEKIMQT